MAEETKTKSSGFEDAMLALFAILLVGQMFNKAPDFIADRWGVEIGGSSYLVAEAGLSADTPHGSKVNTPNGATFFSGPQDEEAGVLQPGTSLVIKGGPETIEGERWWQVQDSYTGNTGWVKESDLVREGVGGISPGTKVGAKARALLTTTVWTAPGGSIQAGIARMGEWGELTKGPREDRGSRWWFFDTGDSKSSGWIPEAALALASESGWGVGSTVKGKRALDMYERAGSGMIVGLLKKGENAKILAGPVGVGGDLWWYITNGNSEKGWVRELDLEEGGARGIVKTIILFFMIVGGGITALLLGGIIYVTIRTNQVRAKEAERIKKAIPTDIEPIRNERWVKVMEHAGSENPNDWRVAIMEADILLDEVITRIGYQGDTLGEKLKQVAKGDMATLDSAWEAHKIRNQIAHEGGDYILTKREAKRVIDLYKSVFCEFKVI